MSGHDWQPRHNKWAVALSVTLVAFMEILDTTIVNVALPHIAGSMSVSNDEATWTLTSYLVANGIVLPISGWLSRVFGRKRYFLICIASFSACSFLCGIADSLWQLILARMLQGFFGGGLQPNQQSIILDTFPPAERSRAFAITAMATIVAPVLGPTLGGLITDNASWRWIFFINLPVGLLTFFLVVALVEDPPWANEGETRIDAIGVGLIALGLGCLQITLDRGEDEDWLGSPFIRVSALLTVIGLVGAVAWLLWTRRPVVDLRVLKDRNFAVGSALISAMAMLLYSSGVVIPQFAQTVLGYTATLAGYVLSPGAILVAITIPVVGKLLLPRVQTRFVVLFGFICLAVAMFHSSRLSPQIDSGSLTFMRMAQTFGLAFLFVPISAIAYATLPREKNADAAALYTMFRNVSGSIGIAVATALVTERTQVRMAHLAANLTPYDQSYVDAVRQRAEALIGLGRAPVEATQAATGMVYRALLQQAQVLAYSDVFLFCAVLAGCAAPLALLFSAQRAAGGGGGH
ncbi:DHA2 family efflux MFS transporter permease subunit [Rhodovastum atsumiense]|uniref:DHA2 family efflux MFS transporter permease subunit n=1 Tax=Rhodovastum atsumiense TaxID=504468 RepID=A0A5M6J0D0_9PROT|nr:DHA2 family efflux MFS transporter permease subunit [Rhodovastum atsumiense]KAA5613058.1 DHA2 family efflux MFS transporter permease subunit [Rhodovastum atsumiense]CAH2600081.1 DHA2 family efflux MFS transporter permease subunit [Rhodovastum atsumiense]